jgi:hypothetical protein
VSFDHERFARAIQIATVPAKGVADPRPDLWAALSRVLAVAVNEIHMMSLLPLMSGEDEPGQGVVPLDQRVARLALAVKLAYEARASSAARGAGMHDGSVGEQILDAANGAIVRQAAGPDGDRRPATWMLPTTDPYRNRKVDRPLAPSYKTAAEENYALRAAFYAGVPPPDTRDRTDTEEKQIDRAPLPAAAKAALKQSFATFIEIDRLFESARSLGPSHANLLKIQEAQTRLAGELTRLGL